MLKRLSATFNGINNEHQHQQQQQPGLSSGPPYHQHPSIAAGGGNHINSAGLSVEQLYAGSSYPRPAALSTPTALSDGGRSSSSSSAGYFNRPYANSAAGSRNTSPLPSPNASVSRAYNPYANSLEAPAAGIERLTLQKSLKALETLLVALDEYRELHTRITKVEKKLGKNVKDLAASMQYAGEGGKAAQSAGPGSIVQALVASGTFFESLSDVSSKHSRVVSKEYETINELSSKFFRKIAKEEKAHDDALESLDVKLKKANYNYDKKVRSTMPGPSSGYNSKQSIQAGFGSAAAAHEQFVPLLNSLAEEMARTKIAHANSMARRREECIAAVARTMTDLSDAEFRKSCEDVRKLGKQIGGILALNALLGNAEKGSNASMPRDWPPELQIVGEDENQPLAGLTRSPERIPEQGTIRQQSQQQVNFPSNSRRSSDAFSNTSSSPRHQDNRQMPAFVSPDSSFQSSSSASQQRQEQVRAVSFGSVRSDMANRGDFDATVTARSSQAKPALDTNFYQQQQRVSSQPISQQQESPHHIQQQHQQARQEGSPSLPSSTSARQPLVQTPLHHSPSHSAKVSSYFPSSAVEGIIAEEEERRSDARQGVKMPSGFVMEETDLSPVKSKAAYRPSQEEQQYIERRSNSGDSGNQESPVDVLEAAVKDITSGPLVRSVSIESTTSEQSFVQRMKAKYAQDRDARSNAANTTARPPPSSNVSPAGSQSSGSKVTSMAQKYEKYSDKPATPYSTDAIYGSPPSNQPSARPTQLHRVSLPVVPSSSYTSTGSASRLPGLAASRSPIPEDRLNRSAENILPCSIGQEGRKDSSRHPSICGCEDCSATGYTSPALQQQRVFNDTLSRNSGQDTIRSARNDRRVSMPMPAGSNRY